MFNVQNYKMTNLLSYLSWLHVQNRDNSIVPILFSGQLQGLSVYQSTPGASQQGLALPLNYYWEPILVRESVSNVSELLMQRAEEKASYSLLRIFSNLDYAAWCVM